MKKKAPDMRTHIPFREKLYSLLITAGLLAPLWIPQTALASNQPWRPELAATVAACIILVASGLFGGSKLAITRPTASPYVLLFAVYTGWALISASWAQNPLSAWHHTIVWCEYILYFALTITWMRDGQFRTVASLLALVVTVLGVLCVIEYLAVRDDLALHLRIFRARYTAYAELISTALPVVLAITLYRRKFIASVAVGLAGGVGWLAVMLSLSKGAFIGGVIGMVVMFTACLLFTDRMFRKRLLVVAAAWLVLTAGVQLGMMQLASAPSTIDYISGKADPERETTLARLFFWRVGGYMFRDHWLIGVGGDNFGAAFNGARARFRVANPDSPTDEPVAVNIVERAHNEPLQIACELGVVGFALVAFPFGLFAIRTLRQVRRKTPRLSPLFWAAFGGVIAFAASSMSSSFAFRFTPNGIVFFVVFGIAVSELWKASRSRRDSSAETGISPSSAKVAAVAVPVVLGAMVMTLALKAAAEYVCILADEESDGTKAIARYQRVTLLDPDYKSAYLKSSVRSYQARDFREAARQIDRGIDGGLGVDLTYSTLADCYEQVADIRSAAQTLERALAIYPRDVFLRVRLATFWARHGRNDLAAANLAAARNVDLKQANGWYQLLTTGSVKAYLLSRQDPSVAAPNDLIPNLAVLQYLDPTPGSSPQ